MSYEHIDVSRISGLTRELADDASVSLRFIEDYIRCWEQRRARVSGAIELPVIDDALAALLSLATSSAMIGADGLSCAAKALHADARLLGTVPAPGAERLARLGAAVCEELRIATADMRPAA